ncbi:hypothetical protein NMY22_g11247 [Coprinellus aureogranulatus]|nr:hypothetical protein NMY22_g11247 [Coprinellus aureogranulatus]
MTDLTVLVSPTPLLPSTRGLFTKKTQFSTPIMVTLEAEVDSTSEGGEEVDSRPRLAPQADTGEDFVGRAPRLSRTKRNYDSTLLSPPVNTWKAPRPRPGHRPTRSQSAPPERRSPVQEAQEGGEPEKRSQELPQDFGYRPRPRRAITSFTAGSGGELVRPPPPLLRPTTFWRKTRKSGVSEPSYSPSTHLIRRSTYIAAGLSFDAPIHDLSALTSLTIMATSTPPAPVALPAPSSVYQPPHLPSLSAFPGSEPLASTTAQPFPTAATTSESRSAINSKDVEQISRWVNAGADINVEGDDGQKAFNVACSQEGQHQLVSLLIEKDVDQAELLAEAIRVKNPEYVSLCVRAGADVNVRTPEDQTALDVAFAQEDQHELVSLLRNKGVDLNKVLITAVNAKNFQYISRCVAYGADLDAQTADGKTALEVTIMEKQWDLVPSIVEAGANVNLQFRSSTLLPSLIYESVSKFTEIKPSVSGWFYEPALLAAFNKDAPIDVLELMLEKGADPNAQGGEYNEACLPKACRAGREEVVSLLLRVKYGANPDIQGE